MPRVVSVHEYTLAAGVDPAAFERAAAEAERRGLFDLPGPVEANEYPECWRTWEKELLAPLLDCDPDDIAFTSYEEL